MLRHIFIGPATEGATREQIAEVLCTLRGLPALVPEIRRLTVEPMLGLSNEGQGIVLMAEFDSQADWKRYMSDPGHLALGDRIKDCIDLARMTVVQTDAGNSTSG